MELAPEMEKARRFVCVEVVVKVIEEVKRTCKMPRVTCRCKMPRVRCLHTEVELIWCVQNQAFYLERLPRTAICQGLSRIASDLIVSAFDTPFQVLVYSLVYSLAGSSSCVCAQDHWRLRERVSLRHATPHTLRRTPAHGCNGVRCV